jgi:hypothetical protein
VTETVATVVDLRSLDDPPGVENPYWQTVRKLEGDDLSLKYEHRWELRGFDVKDPAVSRKELVKPYSWAITDPAAVAFVVEHCGPRVVEVGAGTGYWAWQLSQRGVDVVAYDKAPPDMEPNDWHCHRYDDVRPVGTRETWHPVLRGDGPSVSAVHSDRTLFLCWPPYGDEMAADTLAAYSGDRLVYIGEGYGGCTGDGRFHAMLGDRYDEDEPQYPPASWREVATHRPVQWWGLHDWISVYERLDP